MSESIKSSIEHKGFIERITENSVIVKIISESACAACHAKGACTAADMQDKEIEVKGIHSGFAIGENVTLIMSQSMGFKALVLGYVYPFLILFFGLILASSTGISELYAGLIALSLLPPYYLVMYLLRNNIKKSFTFSIRKIV